MPQAWEEELGRSKILIVEDDPNNVRFLERLMLRAGFRDVTSTTDPRKAEPIAREIDPDLVLLDMHMPHMNGFEVMARIVPRDPAAEVLPILVLTADTDPELRERALSAGARDFLTKPFQPAEVVLRCRNLLATRLAHRQLQKQNVILELKVEERTRELAEAQVEILHRLAIAAEYRDDVTGQHAERVGILSAFLAQELGLEHDRVRLIRRAAPLHDVGKIGIPDAILMKPGRLTAAEFEVMKSHTVIGGRILSGSRYPLLELARTIALTHHERWDGQGYGGTKGDEIPLEGRIVAVADVFDSLTHERPYKPALTVEDAIEEIKSEGGKHFDPKVVEAFKRLVDTGRLREVSAHLSAATLDLPPRPVVSSLAGAGAGPH